MKLFVDNSALEKYAAGGWGQAAAIDSLNRTAKPGLCHD
jgi:hypothetical protein